MTYWETQEYSELLNSWDRQKQSNWGVGNGYQMWRIYYIELVKESTFEQKLEGEGETNA